MSKVRAGVLTVGSLFAGIGGFDLGLERAGMRSVWQCELDPYCIRVLEKHWPDVLRVRDVRDVGVGTVPQVDVICGGFPCQPVSFAGLGRAQADERWLWPEFGRVVGELRPRYVIVENVPGLLVRGMGDVLGDLAALRYDTEWACVRAADVGAPHLRERVWIVAYPQALGLQGAGPAGQAPVVRRRPADEGGAVPDPDARRLEVGGEQDRGPAQPGLEASQRHDADGLCSDVADADSIGRDRRPRVFGSGWGRRT